MLPGALLILNQYYQIPSITTILFLLSDQVLRLGAKLSTKNSMDYVESDEFSEARGFW